jgi:hypothetical protein
MKRICYGIAIPGLLASSVIFVHLSAKTVFVRVLRNTEHLTSNSWQHWTFWLGLIVVNAALAFVLAEGEYSFVALDCKRKRLTMLAYLYLATFWP